MSNPNAISSNNENSETNSEWDSLKDVPMATEPQLEITQEAEDPEPQFEATQETENPEPQFEITREEIIPGMEIVLPQTKVGDELLAKHRPKMKREWNFAKRKAAWEKRPIKLVEAPEHRLVPERESVNRAEFSMGQTKDQAIDAAVHNQLAYLDKKINGYYDQRSSEIEENDLASLKHDKDALFTRSDHQANVYTTNSQVNERLCMAKAQAISELYAKANVVEKWKLKEAGIEDEIEALRKFDVDDFRRTERAKERAAQRIETIEPLDPYGAVAANLTQDTLDKLGGELRSPDIVTNEAGSESETEYSPEAESSSFDVIDNLHKLAQENDRKDVLDMIYGEDWIKHYDAIVRELFDGDYGHRTQQEILQHMTREEISHNIAAMLADNTFGADDIKDAMERSGNMFTQYEANLLRSYGANIPESQIIFDGK